MNNGYGRGGGGGYQQQQYGGYQQHQQQHHRQQWQHHEPQQYFQQQQQYNNTQRQQYQTQGHQQYQPQHQGQQNMGRGGMMPVPSGMMPLPGMVPPGGGMQRPGYNSMGGMHSLNSPSPPLEEEDDRDPRLDDPWLIEFSRRHEKGAVKPDSEWAAHKIKARVREVYVTVQQLKFLETQISSQPNNNELQSLAKSYMERIEELFTTLNPADPEYERFKLRMTKNRKHKAWLKKARDRVKEDKKNKVQKTTVMNRLIDEWQSKLISKDLQRRKMDEDRKHKKLAEKQRLIEKKEATHLHDVLIKLEELRSLRAQTLELEGQEVSTTTLSTVLQQYLIDHPIIEEDAKMKVEDLEDEEAIVITKVEDEDNEKEGDEEKKQRHEAEAGEPKPLTEEDVRKYYEQAYESLDRLVTVRRAWDQFVVPAGYGTRIPPTFLTAPSPSSRSWRKFIKRKKSKKKRSAALASEAEVAPDTMDLNSTDLAES